MSHTSLPLSVRWGRNNTQLPHMGTKIHIKVSLLRWSDTDRNMGVFITTGRSSWREMKKGRASKFSVTGFSCPRPSLPGKSLYFIHFPLKENNRRAPPAVSPSSISVFASQSAHGVEKPSTVTTTKMLKTAIIWKQTRKSFPDANLSFLVNPLW